MWFLGGCSRCYQLVVLEVGLEGQLAVGDGGEQAAQAAQLPLFEGVARRLGRRRARLQQAIRRRLVARALICAQPAPLQHLLPPTNTHLLNVSHQHKMLVIVVSILQSSRMTLRTLVLFHLERSTNLLFDFKSRVKKNQKYAKMLRRNQ